MITLEEQIRRYAVDVAGPAVAERPTDLDVVGSPRHRGRWMLVGALALFVAGLTWMATRPSELSDRPSVDTPRPPAVTSWAGGPGACTDEVDGIAVEGPDAVGLCVGSTPQPDGATSVGFFVDGVGMGAFEITDCDLIDADRTLTGAGAPVGDGSAWFWLTSDQVRTLVVHLPDGGEVAASTFEVPGVTGMRLAALRLPPGAEENGPFDQYDSEGQPYEPQGGPPVSWPDWCPEAQLGG